MKDLKETHPAEFAKAKDIADEPTFVWRVHVLYTLGKSDVIISAVKSCVRKTSHKYGIEVLSIAHTYRINKKNGDNFWCQAI